MIAIPKIEGQCTKVNPSQMLTTGIGASVSRVFGKIYASHLDFIVKETPPKVGKIVTYGFLLAVGFSFVSPLLRPLCHKKRLKITVQTYS